ncbi:hypothetical protein DV738_g1397, partial [Chaetothyriales sp. CBS 135597]
MPRRDSEDSTKSKTSTESIHSVYSEDSYIATFEATFDDAFREMLDEVKMLGNNRKILLERKVQSHNAKKRDPNDTAKRTDWTPQMEAEYQLYKVKVAELTKAKKDHKLSEKAAKQSKNDDLATIKRLRNKALSDAEKWLNAGIEAAKARLDFMSKYPNAFSTPATRSHIKAAEDCLNSAKRAKREIEIQKTTTDGRPTSESDMSSAGYRLLDGAPPDADEDEGAGLDVIPLGHASVGGKRLGLFRAIYVVALCATGSFLFAYDTGIVGGVLTLPSFQRDFRYSAADKIHVNSNCVSILQAGAFFGCFLVWPLTARLGRRWAYVTASAVFCVGAVIQTVNTHSIGLFYAGRVISGLGTGAATVLVPMFSAEMAPKEIRGALGSCFQLFFAIGVCASYWVTYAASVGLSKDSSTQWQLPVGLQLVPGVLMGFGMLLTKESVRWLTTKGRNEEALESLIWIRGGEYTEEVRKEFAEIIAGVELEISESEGLTWRELLLPSNRLRIFIAVTVQLCAQLTGNTSLAYYAPQIFNTVGAGDKSLFVTGFFGLAKMAGVATFSFFLVDRIGRKKPFIGGAFAMGTLMLIIAILVATHPPEENTEDSAITPSAAAGIAMVYLEAFAFNMSWGPLAWLYIGEIFPSRIREIGIATGAASQWLFNFMMSQITPYAIETIGWRTFLMFSVFNYAIIFYSWYFLRETAHTSLEEMEVIFGTVKRLPTDDDKRAARMPPKRKGRSGVATGRPKRRATRQTKESKSEIPDVYMDMLAEVAAQESAAAVNDDNTGRPGKRRKLSEEVQLESKQPPSSPIIDHQSVPGADQEEPRQQQTVLDDFSASSDDEDADFEDVEIDNVVVAEDDSGGLAPEQTTSLEIDLSKQHHRPTLAGQQRRRKIASPAERALRLSVHKTHLLLLLFSVSTRNRWCESTEVQAALKPLVRKKTIRQLHLDESEPQWKRSTAFNDAIKEIADMWRTTYTINARGMRRAHWRSNIDMEREMDEAEDMVDLDDFKTAAHTRSGSRDLGAQLFCALLRACAVDTRLVCSLQVLPFSAVSAAQQQTGTEEASESPYPIFWVEVFSPAISTWIPVDPLVRHTINKPKTGFEPPASDALNAMSYVIAFEGDDGSARDVTRRYAQWFNAKTRKTRVESTKGGAEWYASVMGFFAKPFQEDRDAIEDIELARRNELEGMPKSIQDFKGHPLYVLERHLRQNEKRLLVPVFRRKDVHICRSADAWYRRGRDVLPGEAPLKHAVRRNQPLYAEFQTQLYHPPPVTITDGRIPRNAFGNLDVYVPSMIPAGAIHVRHPLAAKAARVLGIDYADAVTGFEFKGRHGTAVIDGVVVSATHRVAIVTVIVGLQSQASDEAERQRSRVLLAIWKKLPNGKLLPDDIPPPASYHEIIVVESPNKLPTKPEQELASSATADVASIASNNNNNNNGHDLDGASDSPSYLATATNKAPGAPPPQPLAEPPPLRTESTQPSALIEPGDDDDEDRLV